MQSATNPIRAGQQISLALRRILQTGIGLSILALATLINAADSIPHLKRSGSATQLIVDDQPFLILGGELGNSSASDLDYLSPHWDTFQELNMNTVVAPVYWELMEPEEGNFDFTLVDGLIEGGTQPQDAPSPALVRSLEE